MRQKQAFEPCEGLDKSCYLIGSVVVFGITCSVSMKALYAFIARLEPEPRGEVPHEVQDKLAAQRVVRAGRSKERRKSGGDNTPQTQAALARSPFFTVPCIVGVFSSFQEDVNSQK